MKITDIDNLEVSYLTSGTETKQFLKKLETKLTDEFNSGHPASTLEPERLEEFKSNMELFRDLENWITLLSEQQDQISKRLAMLSAQLTEKD